MKRTMMIIITVLLAISITPCNGCGKRKQDLLEKFAVTTDSYEQSKLLKENKKYLHKYVGDEDVETAFYEKLKSAYQADNSLSFKSLLQHLEEVDFKSESLKEKISHLFDESTFEQRIERANYFSDEDISYYFINVVTLSEVEDYIQEEPLQTIAVTGNEGGYYDKSSNRMQNYSDKIMFNGDIKSATHQYFGDFAIEKTKTEYVDSYYTIQHKSGEALYFRGAILSYIDKINMFSFTPPYLFSANDGKIQIYQITGDDGKYKGYITYNEPLNDNLWTKASQELVDEITSK